MISVILRTGVSVLQPLLLLVAAFLLIRGHHEPGGGFSGGLMAGAAFVFYAVSHGVGAARRQLRVEPSALIGGGLLLAAGSGVFSLLTGRPFMSSLWATLDVSEGAQVGTPFLFDLGVFLVSTGAVLWIVFSLWKEGPWRR